MMKCLAHSASKRRQTSPLLLRILSALLGSSAGRLRTKMCVKAAGCLAVGIAGSLQRNLV